MTDFRIIERGGVWWIEQYVSGNWVRSSGPYKRKDGAESALQRVTEKNKLYLGFAKETAMGTAAHSELMENHLAHQGTWWNETTAAYAAAGYPYGSTLDDLVRWWKDSDEKRELERLRIENAALREIVEVVADAECKHATFAPRSSFVLILADDTLSNTQHLIAESRALLRKSAEEVK